MRGGDHGAGASRIRHGELAGLAGARAPDPERDVLDRRPDRSKPTRASGVANSCVGTRSRSSQGVRAGSAAARWPDGASPMRTPFAQDRPPARDPVVAAGSTRPAVHQARRRPPALPPPGRDEHENADSDDQHPDAVPMCGRVRRQVREQPAQPGHCEPELDHATPRRLACRPVHAAPPVITRSAASTGEVAMALASVAAWRRHRSAWPRAWASAASAARQ